MPHYIILTPWDSPIAYVAWSLIWLSSLTGMAVGISFFRRGHGCWWLMAAIIFALPLVGEIVRPARLGLPPLPYGEEQGVFRPAHAPVTPPIFGSTGSTQVEETTIKSTSHLNSFPLLMSIAFAWAYVAERKKRGYATAGN